MAIRKLLQKILRFAQDDTVVWWLSQHNVRWFLRTAPPHCHCEERSDVAIRNSLQKILRFAQNDMVAGWPSK